uniref:Uncharacterized protein n=1 Tax=Hemiselmis andersenii TaxID=464988 RepID=A0A6T8GU84_HEMAN|mmetsp:Transcript_6805/g.16537  ORF Transcript_6805/g.16537 Transcript_6805/m.16537 type:complete len:317 (-) Transcript_6805:188-1138(-)|eukprot:CAMPEP_0114135324 /NCGR_PEP_ID=MMETSP0043_2-20121206/14639_1 /TAXON_ID=464988 /ORGANISM="Hemiselmis andersenii, Strain CCMP644" /LENGTH=316 /DNA_ID=CAMNT_0001229041 /DNA_START=89 /DNA_END=1039 /DNA_ORIENTATION=-
MVVRCVEGLLIALSIGLPLVSAWVAPGVATSLPQLRASGPSAERRASSFVGGFSLQEHNEVVGRRGRGSATHVSPVMMGRAAAKRAVTKGKTDLAKTKLNSRYGKMVTMCVKAGGTDPIANPALAKLLVQAKQAGVPVANMENVIKRANNKDQADFKESTYEVYGQGGIGFVIDILTDNNNRAAGDVRTVLNKNKLKMAEPGSVAFNFDHVGCVTVITDKGEDDVTEAALEAGADDLEETDLGEDGAGFNVYTEMTSLMAVSDSMKDQGFEVKEARFIWKPKGPIEVSEEDETANLDAIDMLEELDDVDAVWHNMS